MPRKGENIYKRKDGRWEGRYIKSHDENGKIIYGYIYAKSYATVKNKLVQAKMEVLKKSAPKEVNGQITYRELSEQWLAFKKFQIKESTYVKYKLLITNHILPSIGNHKICRITTKMLEELVRSLLKKGRLDGRGGLSNKTVCDIITLIKSIYYFAKTNDYEMDCNVKLLSVKRDCPDIRIISHNELTLLKALLIRDTDIYKAGILLSMYTGIRIGELCALQWKNIDLENRIVTIQSTMQRIKISEYEGSNAITGPVPVNNPHRKTKLIITNPKTKSSIRKIPLHDHLAELLIRFKAADNAFFLTGTPEKYVEPRTMQNHFKRCIRECNMEDINFHALRHTFATRCIELGFEIKSLSEILGHANVNITLNRYVHSSFELKRKNMEKLVF